MASPGRFFEKQNDRDCTIHSLNNAMGAVVVTKPQVLARIDRLTKEYSAGPGSGQRPSAEEIRRYRDRMASGNSFFSAEVVWDTAVELGTVGSVSPVPGFGGDFANLDTLPSWVRSASLVFLGLDSKGRPHAVAARDGLIYDSQRWASDPKPLNNRELSKVMNRVFALFVVRAPGQKELVIARVHPALASKSLRYRARP